MPEELDELNRLFTSKNVDDVIKFYDHFDTPEQLIEWMKNRPSAPMKIYEVEGNKDIVIVIPTANHEGELAKNCANNIFKGQQIIFIESNGPFFNYARSCNYGLKYALKYNPKWIILSNDDVLDLGGANYFFQKLSQQNYDIITPKQNYRGHFYPSFVAKQTIFLKLFYILTGRKYILNLFSKFNVTYRTPALKKGCLNLLKYNLLYKKVVRIPTNTAFTIFSSSFVARKDKVLDETCINAGEELSLWLDNLDTKFGYLDLPILDKIGTTLGNSTTRSFRDFTGLIYFNYKFRRLYSFNHK